MPYLKMIFYALGENITSQLFSQEHLKKGRWEFNVFDQFEDRPYYQTEKVKETFNFDKEIDQYNNFVYENKEICKLSFKNSVTGAIKLNDEEQIIPYKTETSEELASAQIAIDRGNAYHEALKLLDFHLINTIDDLQTQLMVVKSKMTERYLQLLNHQILLKNIIRLLKNLQH